MSQLVYPASVNNGNSTPTGTCFPLFAATMKGSIRLGDL
jgi:hypothetical protein